MCEFLTRYVQKQSNKGSQSEQIEQEENKNTDDKKQGNELMKKIAQGAVQLARSKKENEASLLITTQQNRKGKGKQQKTKDNENTIDF